MCMKSTSNINKSQKSCLTDLSKLFVACSSWRILKHRLTHIFDCHPLRIFESFQDTSKIPTFTLLIKTNARLHLKMLSCNFYFLKNLTDFRHIILQPAETFNPKFLRENLIENSFKKGDLQIKHFFTSSISFLPNPVFSVIIIHIQVCIHPWYTQPSKKRLVESITFRSSHRRYSVRKDLKNFLRNSQQNICVNVFFNKVVGLKLQLH